MDISNGYSGFAENCLILISETKTILLLLLFITVEPGDGGTAA